MEDKLYLGDCLEVMDKLIEQGVKVDAIITDPPYTISKDSGYINNSKHRIDYIAKYGKHKIDFGKWDKENIDLKSVMDKCFKLLKDNGTLILFYDVWKINEIKELADLVGFKQPRVGIWIKSNPVPINSKLNYLSNAKEFFVSFVKKSNPTFNSEYDFGIYRHPICHGKERTKHPTQKPLILMEEIIKKHTNENELIIDFTMGSGTTCLASKNLNRRYIGIERDEVYFEIAKQRIETSNEYVINNNIDNNIDNLFN